jgi:hypothetical protein
MASNDGIEAPGSLNAIGQPALPFLARMAAQGHSERSGCRLRSRVKLILYLRGISTGDFQEALSALLGKDVPNLSPSVISGLKAQWQGEYERWQKRDLSARRYVYVCVNAASNLPRCAEVKFPRWAVSR